MLTAVVLCAAWCVLARELNTGRRKLSRLEAYTFFAVLAVVSVGAVT